MALKRFRQELRNYFLTGLRPTAENFAELIESNLNILEDRANDTQALDANDNDRFITPKTASVIFNTKKLTGYTLPTTPAAPENITVLDTILTAFGKLQRLINGKQNTLISANAPVIPAVATANANIKTIDGMSIVISNPNSTDTDIIPRASALKTPRTINGVSFDGSQNIVIPQVSVQSAFLNAIQTNNSVTPTFVVLTGHTFTIPAGKSAVITGNLIFTTGAPTTGAGYGIRIMQPLGANANAIGSWSIEVSVTSASAASGLRDGDVFNVAANTNVFGSNSSAAASASGNNSAKLNAVIKNLATNLATTVTIEFQSKVGSSAVNAQIGSGTVVIIS